MTRRRLAALAAAMLMLAAFATPVSARDRTLKATDGPRCEGGFARLFGDDNFQPDAPLILCRGWGIPDLELVYDRFPGNCERILGIDNGHWNNCVSSVTTNQPDGVAEGRVCFYTDKYYDTSGGYFWLDTPSDDPDINSVTYSGVLDGSYDDRISSVRWRAAGQTC